MHTRNGNGFNLGMFLIIAMFAVLGVNLMAGCSPQGDSTLGNGKVDLVEAATIRVAVGMAFTARPDTVVPAYRVATGLLVVLDADAAHSQPGTELNSVPSLFNASWRDTHWLPSTSWYR